MIWKIWDQRLRLTGTGPTGVRERALDCTFGILNPALWMDSRCFCHFNTWRLDVLAISYFMRNTYRPDRCVTPCMDYPAEASWSTRY